MILRHVLKKDLPALEKVLKPWSDEDPGILDILENLVSAGFGHEARCRILEIDKAIHCVSVWIPIKSKEVRILALALGQAPGDPASEKFLREEILGWVEMGITKVGISIPQSLSSSLTKCLRTCGFMFEGFSSCLDPAEKPGVRLCKHFLYRSVSQPEVLEFLRDLLLSLGYEIRNESEGFGYRIREEFRLPFMFSPWHRITRSGTDIIIHPPARILEPHELETLFFPLRIQAENEKPLLLPMEYKRACQLIDLPDGSAQQNTLFEPVSFCHPRSVHFSDMTYTHPAALKGIRKGLPLVFYVNGTGAVGVGRVEDWRLDKPDNPGSMTEETGCLDSVELQELAASSGPMAGKVLVLSFQWYKPFKKPVALEEIRRMDESFNPQRTRALSPRLFQSILDWGNRLDT